MRTTALLAACVLAMTSRPVGARSPAAQRVIITGTQKLRLRGVSCPTANQIVAVGSNTASPPVPQIALFIFTTSWQVLTFQPGLHGELTALAVGYRPMGKPAPGFRSWSLRSTDPASGVWKEDQQR